MKKVLSTAILTVLAICVWAPMAFAQAGAADNNFTTMGYLAIGAGLAMGLAAFGGAMGQGRAAAAALEAAVRPLRAGDRHGARWRRGACQPGRRCERLPSRRRKQGGAEPSARHSGCAAPILRSYVFFVSR